MTARLVFIALTASAASLAWTPFEHLARVTDTAAYVAQADPADGPAELTAEEIVSRVQATYDDMTTYRASFEQRYTNEALGDTDVSTGNVFFLKPGMMRWDYATPTVRHFISDGSDLWIYEPAEAQYFTQPLDDSELPTALRFLMGTGQLADDFDITVSSQTDERIELRLLPREDEGQYDELQFIVDPSDWSVTEVVIFDPIGNTNHLVFTDAVTGEAYTPADFAFTPPAGTRQVEDPMGQ